MIIVVGLILIVLLVWGVRAALRRVRRRARARAEAKARTAASSPPPEDADKRSPAQCSSL